MLNPAETKDLYFVADGSGGHVFAENLKDHNANVAKWRVIEKEAKTKTSPPAPEETPTTAAPKVRATNSPPDKSKSPAPADPGQPPPAAGKQDAPTWTPTTQPTPKTQK